MDNRYRIVFTYADYASRWEERTQECLLYGKDKYDAVQKCKNLYGLGIDCEYRIISVENA